MRIPGPDIGTAVVIASIVAVLMAGSPAVMALPSTAVSFLPNPISAGATTVATVHLTGANCPTGDTYLAKLLIDEPNGHQGGVESFSMVSCGTDATFTYPTDFHAPADALYSPSTETCGAYSVDGTGSFAYIYGPGGISDQVGTIQLSGGFGVTCSTAAVPQFPLGVVFIVAVMIPVLLLLRKKSLLPGTQPR